jgi:hypothetical protein
VFVLDELDELAKMPKKLQDAQTLTIHVVSEDFLNEVEKDRPSVAMEKCQISSWGVLPHVRQQSQANDREKSKSGQLSAGTTSSKSS